MKQLTLNLQTGTEATGEMTILSSPVASPDHASHTAQQAKDWAKKMIAISGRRCYERYEKFNRHGLWAKTFSALLIGTGDWYSMKCKLTWKVKGTKYNRMYFQLQVSTLRTDEIEFGLLLTPTTMDIKPTQGRYEKRVEYRASIGREWAAGCLTEQIFQNLLPTPMAQSRQTTLEQTKARQEKYGGKRRAMYLENFAVMGMLPTPAARDEKNGSKITDGRIQRKMKQGWTIDLNDMATIGMLPTPATRDYKGARSSEALQEAGRNHTNSLPDSFSQPGKSSQLNPRFVMEMMGFPPTHTLKPFQKNIEWIEI